MVAQYVTKNSAPRDVYNSKLTGTFKKTEISNLFRGSGQFINTEANTFDALIIDEAHRLNAKS
jgi:superfamily II DNA or RNA helicase